MIFGGKAKDTMTFTWTPYKVTEPIHETFVAHPAQIVESTNLATTPAPLLVYELHLSRQLLSNGGLSSYQQETIRRACQSMAECGAFLLADGTGSGKGRVLAGTALEYIGHNPRTKVAWVSVNKRLFQDARRDMNALQPDSQNVQWGMFNTNLSFMSYHDFLDPTRVTSCIQWLNDAPVGLVLLDEAHALRHGCSMTTQILQAVSQLGVHVHVLYSTATPASTPSHLRFVTRLGLWGIGTSFATFSEFQNTLSKYGTTAMELTAMQLKASGRFVSRQLAMRDVKVSIVKHELSTMQKETYNLFTEQLRAFRECGGPMHQLFFQRILSSFKVSTACELIRKGLREGFAVIVSLQTTGQATDERHISPQDPEFVSSSWDVFQRLTDRRVDPKAFPLDAIDALIEEFGEENVAEITGRAKRVVKGVDGELMLKQKPSSLDECREFQTGRKMIAVISRAGSTGISLHDEGTHPRLHVCLELPWSSEDLMQQCGRTHRSNAATVPQYIFIHTDVPAELRFASAISQKLRNMGALSRGDRETSSTFRVHSDTSTWNARVRRDVACRILFATLWRRLDYANIENVPFGDALSTLKLRNTHSASSVVHGACWKALLAATTRRDETQFVVVEDEEGESLASDSQILGAIQTLLPQAYVWRGRGWTPEAHLKFSMRIRKNIETLYLIRNVDGSPFEALPFEVFHCICEFVAQSDVVDMADLYYDLPEQGVPIWKIPIMDTHSIQNRALGLDLDSQESLFAAFSQSSDIYSKSKSGVFSVQEYILRGRSGAFDVHCVEMTTLPDGKVVIRVQVAVDVLAHSNKGEFFHSFLNRQAVRAKQTRRGTLLFHPYEKRPFRQVTREQWEEDVRVGRYVQTSPREWEGTSATKLRRLRRQAQSMSKTLTLVVYNAIDSWAASEKVILRVAPPFSESSFTGLLVNKSQ